MPNGDDMRKIKNACGVIDTACTIFALENRSYLGEFEQGHCLMKKTGGRKSRDTVPLIEIARQSDADTKKMFFFANFSLRMTIIGGSNIGEA
jgi:hypothetical protein